MNFDVLRQKILEKAIRGELVPQLESEPEVEQIGEAPEDVPFEIPEKWKWVPVNKIIELISGRDLDKSLIEEKASSSSVPYITGASQISSNEVLVNRWTSNGSVFSDNGDLLLTCKGTIGKLAINQIGICHIARQIMAIRPKDQISVDFAKIFFSAIENKLTSNAKSMIPGISRNNVLSLLCPLPPIEEQRRIVQRHNEIILEIDKAESAYNELAGPLSDRLHQLLLERAIQGKLVPQLESEPKVELQNEKESFEIPFEIPSKWKWTTLEQICLQITDGEHKTPKYQIGGVPFLSVKDISSKKLNFSNTKFVSLEDFNVIKKRCYPQKGDILLSKVGSTGIPAIVDTDKEFALFVSVALLKLNKLLVLDKFLWYLLQSPLVQKQAKENTRGIGNKNWVLKAIKATMVPLPPILEQHRIVDQLEKIFSSINSLSK